MKTSLSGISLRGLLFPERFAVRVIIHMSFWLAFIFVHLLFFLPSILRGELNMAMILSYVLYYGKFIFIFYAWVASHWLLSKRFSGIPLWFTLLLLGVALTHLLSILTFKTADMLIGLGNATLSFEMLGRLFLSDNSNNYLSKLSLLIYDIQDLQLLILPIGIKMVKYGILKEKQRQDLESEQVKTELYHLKSQLSPHFILNIINSAYAKILPVSKEAASYLGGLAEIVHYALYDAHKDMIPLEKEIHCFKSLIDLESTRRRSRMTLSMEEQGEIKPDYRIPSLLLMTLAENAFKHGVSGDHVPSRLDVRILIKNHKLEFEIENSKTGSPTFFRQSHPGIGLENIVKRLKLHFKNDFIFQIKEAQHTYRVNLTIPLS